jgi:hypothetical protein
MEHCVVERFSVTLSFSGKKIFFLQKSLRLYICFHIDIFSLKVNMLGSVGHLLQSVFFVGPKTIGGRLCCSYKVGGGDFLHHLTRWIILHFLMNFCLFFLII